MIGRIVAVLVLALVPAGCEDLTGHKETAARALVEACLREANVQGETAGKLGMACRALNDWVKQQGWAAQP
jgi:hypothetical protein